MKLKKITAILLTAALMLGLTACGGDDFEPTPRRDRDRETDETIETVDTTPQHQEPKEEEPQEIIIPDMELEKLVGLWACGKSACSPESIVGHTAVCNLFFDSEGRFADFLFSENGGAYSIFGETITLTWDYNEYEPITFMYDGINLILIDEDFSVQLDQRANINDSVSDLLNVYSETATVGFIEENTPVRVRPEEISFSDFLIFSDVDWVGSQGRLPRYLLFYPEGVAIGNRDFADRLRSGEEDNWTIYEWVVTDDFVMRAANTETNPIRKDNPFDRNETTEMDRTLILTNPSGESVTLKVTRWEYRPRTMGAGAIDWFSIEGSYGRELLNCSFSREWEDSAPLTFSDLVNAFMESENQLLLAAASATIVFGFVGMVHLEAKWAEELRLEQARIGTYNRLRGLHNDGRTIHYCLRTGFIDRCNSEGCLCNDLYTTNFMGGNYIILGG
jgi:hypothetical protein